MEDLNFYHNLLGEYSKLMARTAKRVVVLGEDPLVERLKITCDRGHDWLVKMSAVFVERGQENG